VSKVVSLLVKVGALVFVLALPTTDIINYQTAGGVWMINALPALIVALYVKRLNVWAMVAGWAAGMAVGTYALFAAKFATRLHDFGFGLGKLYIGFAAIVVNLVVVAIGSVLAELAGHPTRGTLTDADYREPAPGQPQAALPRQPLATDTATVAVYYRVAAGQGSPGRAFATMITASDSCAPLVGSVRHTTE